MYGGSMSEAKNRQQIESGDSSTNVQASGDVYMGMGYTEIRLAMLDLFEQNYDRLLAAAGLEAARRAGEVTDAFLDKMKGLPGEMVANLGEPGVQHALIRAQVEHATSGEPGDAELYAELLMERLQNPAKNLRSIACQQAIETVGQLTQQHVDMLSCLFVLLKVHFTARTVLHLHTMLKEYLGPIADSMTDDVDVIRHLDATSCVAFDTTRSHHVVSLLRAGYADLLVSTFAEEDISPAAFTLLAPWRVEATAGGRRWQVNAGFDAASLLASQPEADQPALGADLRLAEACKTFTDEHVLDVVCLGDERVRRVYSLMDSGERFLSSCFLSNKGLAIGHANLAKRMPNLGALSVWLS